MNKKIGVLIIVSLILFSLLSTISLTSAGEAATSAVESAAQKFEQTEQNIKNIEANKESYLQQQWTNILNNTRAGSVLIALNPVFKVTLGMPFEVSLTFLLSLIAWISLVVIIFFAAKDAFQANAFISAGIALIIPSFTAPFKIIPKFTSFFVPLLKNPWLILTAIGAVVLILALYSHFMEKYGAQLKKSETERIEKKELEQRKTLMKLRDVEIKKRKAGLD